MEKKIPPGEGNGKYKNTFSPLSDLGEQTIRSRAKKRYEGWNINSKSEIPSLGCEYILQKKFFILKGIFFYCHNKIQILNLSPGSFSSYAMFVCICWV